MAGKVTPAFSLDNKCPLVIASNKIKLVTLPQGSVENQTRGPLACHTAHPTERCNWNVHVYLLGGVIGVALIYLLSYAFLVLFRYDSFGIFIVPLILTSWPLVGHAR